MARSSRQLARRRRTPWFGAVCCAAWLNCGLVMAAPVAPEGSAYRADELAPFFKAAATRRVDVVGIGDSNQLFDNHGWDEGWIEALHRRFGAYATPLQSLGENDGRSSGTGNGSIVFASRSSLTFDYDGAPPEDDALLPANTGVRPMAYVHIPAGETRRVTGHGIINLRRSFVPTSGALRFDVSYARRPDALGSTFRPVIRNNEWPFTELARAQPVDIGLGAPGLGFASVELPAGDRPFSLGGLVQSFTGNITGPFTAYDARFVATTRNAGASFSTMYGVGSQSLRDMAEAFATAGTPFITSYYRRVTFAQENEPVVLVRIHSGLNDQNENLPPLSPWGDDVTAGPSSAEAYEANLRTLVDLLTQGWADAGYAPEGLFFLFTPSHPIADPDDEDLVGYREAARRVADDTPRAAVIDMAQLTSEAELLEGGYRVNTLDRNHLRIGAYTALASRELAALQAGRSWVDVNADGAVDEEDLYLLESKPDAFDGWKPDDLCIEGLRAALLFEPAEAPPVQGRSSAPAGE